MVRRMLDEVKGDEDQAAESRSDRAGGLDRGASGASGASVESQKKRTPEAAQGGEPAQYVKNQPVEYYSETHGEWLPGMVTNVNAQGQIMLNLKPNVWLTFAVMEK